MVTKNTEDKISKNKDKSESAKLVDKGVATRIDPKLLRETIQKSTKDLKKHYTKSDQIFKEVLSTDVAAREFVAEYLPVKLKERVDLATLTVERESFIEPKLKRRLSDIIYSLKTKDNKPIYCYILIEHMSSSNPEMPLKLWRYMLLLAERHLREKGKVPVILSHVFYNGKEKYTAPTSLWDLFADPSLAKEYMTGDYNLINLQAMSDDDIKKKAHLGMLQFFMKYIYERDLIKVWQEFFKQFKEVILIDKANDFLYIRSFLSYTDAKMPESQQDILYNLISDELMETKGDNVVRTIADSYIEKGLERGIIQGFEQGIMQGVTQGIAKGREEGREEGVTITAINMLKQNLDISLIVSVTGLSKEDILKLKNKL